MYHSNTLHKSVDAKILKQYSKLKLLLLNKFISTKDELKCKKGITGYFCSAEGPTNMFQVHLPRS